MTKPRSQLIDLGETPYYHCVCRCVRRAFLCGEDHLTGKSFEHRKGWMVDRLGLLVDVFCIEIASYAVMSNHYHVVLRVDRQQALALDDQSVARRWHQLYGWPLLVHKYLQGKTSSAETSKAKEIIHTWRQRLFDISWFMRCLNEHLARRANEEDQCKGRFWEGRYKSQALLGDAAVLTAMCYVDLNPIRAAIAKTPEDSDHTSIQQRIESVKARSAGSDESASNATMVKLMPLVKASSDKHPNAIGYTFKDYLELIDWAGRSVRKDKRGAINDRLPPILARLELDEDAFLEHVLPTQKHTQPCVLGTLNSLKSLAQKWRQKFIRHQSRAFRLFNTI